MRSDDIQAAETTDDGIASPSHCDSHFNQSLQVTEIAIIAAPHTPAEGGRMPTRVIDDVVGRQDSNAVVCRRGPAEASGPFAVRKLASKTGKGHMIEETA